MREFLVTLPRNIAGCFIGWKIAGHLIAIGLAVVLVASGFDWFYFSFTRSPQLLGWMFPAVIIGQLIPMTLPLFLILTGMVSQKVAITRAGWALGQAALIGWAMASAYKALTGRPHPPHFIGTDTSHIFHFGFLRGGIFWGWPSSHTAVAFAMSVTLFILCPQKRWLGIIALLYAFYIGMGVSMTIHWFSDFASGAVFGTIIGTAVGQSFAATNFPARSNGVQNIPPDASNGRV